MQPLAEHALQQGDEDKYHQRHQDERDDEGAEREGGDGHDLAPEQAEKQGDQRVDRQPNDDRKFPTGWAHGAKVGVISLA